MSRNFGTNSGRFLAKTQNSGQKPIFWDQREPWEKEEDKEIERGDEKNELKEEEKEEEEGGWVEGFLN